MREHLERRKAELQAEYERGRQMLVSMQQEQTNLEQTLLRIDGAMQVLDELLRTVVIDETRVEGVDNGDNR
jgi:predicted nuclease with TOPRIM domain